MKTAVPLLVVLVLGPACGPRDGGFRMGPDASAGGTGGAASSSPRDASRGDDVPETGRADASIDATKGVDAGRPDGGAAPGVDPAPGVDAALGARCPAVPRCDAAAPDPGPARPWRHGAPSGKANHRGRDLFVNPGARQWIIANFRYGLALLESALTDEDVDIYLLRGCGATWEKLGRAATTETAAHDMVEGVGDAPGRLFFEIPAARALGLGRHRIHLVVGGDLSTADLFIEVVPTNTPLFVSDVDGTLTTDENAQTLAILTGSMPETNPEAPQALNLLAAKGYRPLYLTARPEWLARTTQDWIAAKGFPPGIVHTTLTSGGASGAAAGAYKTEVLQQLAAKGLKPSYVFGNSDTDADAYNNAGVQPLGNRIFFQYTDTAWNGRRIEAFGPLLSEFAPLPPACR